MKKRTYDKEFKLNAVSLYHGGNSKTISEISKDLGVPEATLSGWIKQYNIDKEKSFPGSGKIRASEEEFRELKKYTAKVELERDILKKALAIFSQQK
jgi:transposase